MTDKAKTIADEFLEWLKERIISLRIIKTDQDALGKRIYYSKGQEARHSKQIFKKICKKHGVSLEEKEE